MTNILNEVPVQQTEQEIFTEREDLEDIASRVVNETLDHVYTGTDIGGVELNSPLPELSDNWEVPELTIAEKDELHEVLTSENLIPHVTTTLTVDEKDDFLVQRDAEIRGLDKVRARETTSSINSMTDEMFEQMSRDHIEQSNELAELENEMYTLAQMSKEATVEELILIADRIGEIEMLLENIAQVPEHTMLTPIRILTPLGEEE